MARHTAHRTQFPKQYVRPWGVCQVRTLLAAETRQTLHPGEPGDSAQRASVFASTALKANSISLGPRLIVMRCCDPPATPARAGRKVCPSTGAPACR